MSHDEAAPTPAADTADASDSPERKAHVSQLRLVIEVSDWSAALRFYRDALGLGNMYGYATDDVAQLVLEAGKGSIELVHPSLPSMDSEAELSDTTEISDPQVPRMRLAFETNNSKALIEELVAAGAKPVIEPTIVPTDSYSGRLEAPDGMPITIFQSLSGPDFSEPPPKAH